MNNVGDTIPLDITVDYNELQAVEQA